MSEVREPSVFMLASAEKNWWVFDKKFTSQKALPVLPSDDVFKVSDKESVTAGTHLLVCGTDAEKYDPITQSWVPLPNMKVKRKMCVGFCLDDKFYVIGGQGENENVLTCGEVYDETTSEWKRIPGILNGLNHITSGVTQSPPLVAVVNNELYIIETSTNCLMVYRKDTNSWTESGPIPVRADISKGLGVAFKFLGNELLVIGGSTMSESGTGMSIYTCCPNPNDKILNWKLLDYDGSRSHFIMNCNIMMP